MVLKRKTQRCCYVTIPAYLILFDARLFFCYCELHSKFRVPLQK